MRRIRKYIACALSAAMVMSSAFVQGAVVSHAEEQDVGIVATAGDAVELEYEVAEEVELQRDSQVTASGLEYFATNYEIIITGYSGTDTVVNIPSEIDGKSVTCIDGYAFSLCRSLTSITIPNSVTSIGGNAFNGCSGLTNVTIPDSVTSIGYGAFWDCSGLTGVTIPDSVTSVSARAFSGCSGLISVTIPDSVTSIGEAAFSGCSGLTSVTIPDSVTSIGEGAFSGCSGLTNVTIPDSVTSIGEYVFSGCSGLTSITVEDGNTVYDSRNGCNAIIEISSNTLIAGCPKTVIPDSVTSIGYDAFYNCSGLTSITIPNSVTSIGYDAFYNCSGLTSITIPDSVTSIGEYAFRDCSGLTSITIPGSVTSIGEYAFSGCSGLTSITIPDSVTSIGEAAFLGCSSLTSISIPASVTSIGYAAFSSCGSLTSVMVEDDNTIYDSRNDCNAIIKTSSNELITGCQNTVIPASVTSIGEGAFLDCSGLSSINIPDSVTDIGSMAFAYCSDFSISIPNSVTSISFEAFEVCSNLTITCAKDSYAYTYAIEKNIPVNIVASESEKLVISVTDIKLNETTKTLVKGKTVTLKPTVTPSDATNTGVTWKSSDTSVATVSTGGVVTAKKGGTATITCTAADGSGKSATCTITVTVPVNSVKLDAKTKTIAKGKSVTLKATVSPSDATDKAVTWKSSNKNVATVSSNGKVTAKKVGTATITCTTKDGKKTYTCKITVKTPVTKVKLSKTKATLKKGKSVKLKATVTPSKAYQKVTWKSSNTKVATVSSSGKVTAKKKGTATITCTAADGSGRKVTCKITVK